MNTKAEPGKHYEFDYRNHWIEVTLRLCRSLDGTHMYVADVRVTRDQPGMQYRSWLVVDPAAFQAFVKASRAFSEGLTRGCAFIDVHTEPLKAS